MLKKRPCPCCETGTLALKDGKYGWFWGCSNFPKCTHSESHKDIKTKNNSIDSNNFSGEWFEDLMYYQHY